MPYRAFNPSTAKPFATTHRRTPRAAPAVAQRVSASRTCRADSPHTNFRLATPADRRDHARAHEGCGPSRCRVEDLDKNRALGKREEHARGTRCERDEESAARDLDRFGAGALGCPQHRFERRTLRGPRPSESSPVGRRRGHRPADSECRCGPPSSGSARRSPGPERLSGHWPMVLRLAADSHALAGTRNTPSTHQSRNGFSMYARWNRLVRPDMILPLLVVSGLGLSALPAEAASGGPATVGVCFKKKTGAARIVVRGSRCKRAERRVLVVTTSPKAARNNTQGPVGPQGATVPLGRVDRQA